MVGRRPSTASLSRCCTRLRGERQSPDYGEPTCPAFPTPGASVCCWPAPWRCEPSGSRSSAGGLRTAPALLPLHRPRRQRLLHDRRGVVGDPRLRHPGDACPDATRRSARAAAGPADLRRLLCLPARPRGRPRPRCVHGGRLDRARPAPRPDRSGSRPRDAGPMERDHAGGTAAPARDSLDSVGEESLYLVGPIIAGVVLVLGPAWVGLLLAAGLVGCGTAALALSPYRPHAAKADAPPDGRGDATGTHSVAASSPGPSGFAVPVRRRR